MPSYFYHLKFEIYPIPKQSGVKFKVEKEVWLPGQGTDIFDAKAWPSHKLALEDEEGDDKSQWQTKSKDRKPKTRTRSSEESGSSGKSNQGSVIDCGPSRATSQEQDDHETYVPISSNQVPDFPPPNPTVIHRDQEIAKKDWRYGPIRIEGVDMVATDRPASLARGESSAGAEAAGQDITAGLSPGLNSARVTRARFEPVEGKDKEVGWGIVHLYRDGEETSGLGTTGVQVYGNNNAVGITASDGKGNTAQEKDKGVEEDCTTLCIPAVPNYLTPSDFLGFTGGRTREEVSHFRMVMTGQMNRYLVLMKFRSSAAARRWRAEYDGRIFNNMEPETCHVIFIKSITFQTPSTSRPSNTSFPELSHDPFTPPSFPNAFPPPTPSLVELPTCPVCLERMDDTSGLTTILCQHVFHCDCLRKWHKPGCPVCRHTNSSIAAQSPISGYPYDPSNPPFGSGDASLCNVCDCTDDLWICLICGNVGCGRYKGGHAKEHWKESAHNFALEIETQHVWDYAGDLWVHRLIRDKGDSKVIELPSSRGFGGGREEDMVPREKLESIGMEYTHLLTSQLESQRVYFEELVSKAVAKASAASASAATATSRADSALAQLSELKIEHAHLRDEVVPQLEKDIERERKKAEKASEMARGFGRSLQEEKKVSEGLMGRIEHVNATLGAVRGELERLKSENEGLREENRDLLFSITAGEKLKNMEGEGGLEEGEVEGGTVSLPAEKVKRGKGKGRGK